MNMLLLLLTILSLAAAGVFAAAAWRARAEAARRSAARVATLASSLALAEPADADAARPVAVAALFDTAAGAAPGSGALRTPAIATALATALLIGGGMVLRDAPDAAATPRHEAAALELVSMRHARDGRTLTVTGLVRNPPAGAPLAGVAALVFVFDRGGDFVASGRAALELPALDPGQESPFVVRLDDLAEVGRYRVSFRTDEGLLRHTDRRVARQQVTTRQ